ncbi:uncharacterized protein [Elaeis guineensis]|uniref:Uncharacterized protein LOC105054423 isoform X1 n=1 Tax=Elaeis guineensis var. tenera TaxID=51953 RepID=A0A6I9RY85_ELAGV|nr:uncharacterized protein LOC105054423 isoform X1 [Elaeis guineensis]XP_010934225.1 uncharacterized protein LOC105054423 isoform X1 [Elaeis guineensis]
MEDCKEGESLNFKSHLSQTNNVCRHELECQQSQIEALQERLMEVKASIKCSEDKAKRELEHLWRNGNVAATLLTYLKSKARIMANPHLAHVSCGIKHQEGVGLVDKHGIPLCDWSKDVDLSLFESSEEEVLQASGNEPGTIDATDGAYIDKILKSVNMVADVMESLVKRVIMAETEAAIEKEKVNLGMEEIRKKTLQIDSMSAKVEEMERFARGANDILNEMRQKVEDMVQEISRQRQRAAENEQELCHVKQDFEALKSYVSSLISARETLISSEKQFQTMEKLFERLIAKTTRLEAAKVQKEAEVQKLMEENVRLTAVLDKKEAQLLAMNEQMKFMALNNPGM